MRVLLTGGTGFLGKHVLRRLLAESSVERVVIPARWKLTHPDPRVDVITCDLSQPTEVAELTVEVDAVLHLAGQYDFASGPWDNHANNVLVLVNLIEWLSRRDPARRVPIHLASTYAVEAGRWNPLSGEEPIRELPDRSRAYSWTKAQAEILLRESGIPHVIYRMGILVGDTATGRIEKEDGPYGVLRVLERIARPYFLKYSPAVPMPVNPAAFLPLVPVNAAAKVFVTGLERPDRVLGRVFGVYRPGSVTADELVRAMFRDAGLRGVPAYLPRIPDRALRWQEVLTGIPAENFRFGLDSPTRLNPAFLETFGIDAVPPFVSYEQAFFNGARAWRLGRGSRDSGGVA